MEAARIANLRVGDNQHGREGKRYATAYSGDGAPAEEPAQICAPSVTQSAAAEMLNASRPSVQRAREVQEKGVPSLVAAVDPGR